MRTLPTTQHDALCERLGMSRQRLYVIRGRKRGSVKRDTAERLSEACEAVLGEKWPPESFIFPENYPENWFMEGTDEK